MLAALDLTAAALQKKAFSRPWVVSYDDVEPIREMYKRSASLAYGLNTLRNGATWAAKSCSLVTA